MLVGGGVLALAACGGGGQAMRIEHADHTGDLIANLYITVLASGRISLIVNKAEIGQGVSTGYATLVAEERAVPLEHVDVHFADSNQDMRTSSMMQITGGSTSVAEALVPLRRAAASAREMLIAAAAQQWKVPAKDCIAANGHVEHGDQKLAHGDLTKHAARLEAPEKPRRKAAKDCTLVGKSDRRVDIRGKVDGTATFGIDVRVPNMVNAFAIHGPSFGAKPKKVDADRAKRHPGVIDVIAFDWGVAVVAEKFWQARAAAADVAISGGMGILSQSIALSAGDWLGAILSSLPRSLTDMISGAALSIFSSGSFGDPFSTEGIQNSVYHFGNFQLASEPVQTKLPVASWRSVGNSVTAFIMESFIDELAVAAKQDPFALRRTNQQPA